MAETNFSNLSASPLTPADLANAAINFIKQNSVKTAPIDTILFDDEKVPKQDKEVIYKAVNRTIADMESDGIYFSEDAKESLRNLREELHCEYSGLPSPKSYEK